MATTRKGWRTITVDERRYRWMIRREAKYWDNHTRSGIRFTVESDNGALLMVDLARPRLDYWLNMAQEEDLRPVTPNEVANWIQKAVSEGWNPEHKGQPLVLSE